MNRIVITKGFFRCVEASQRSRRSVGQLLLGSLLLLSACDASDAAPAQSGKQGKPARSKQSYAVAGISPGMEESRVGIAATSAGYQLVHQSKGSDWQIELKRAASGNRFSIGEDLKGVREQYFRKGAETISVSYVAMPQGSVAYHIYYSAPSAVLDYAEAARISEQRYGRSSFTSRAGPRWAKWCVPPAPTAQACLKQAHLSLSESASSVSISVQDDGVRERQILLLRQQLGAKATF